MNICLHASFRVINKGRLLEAQEKKLFDVCESVRQFVTGLRYPSLLYLYARLLQTFTAGIFTGELVVSQILLRRGLHSEILKYNNVLTQLK